MIITAILYMIVFLALLFTVGHRKAYIASAVLPVVSIFILGALSVGMSIAALFTGVWVVVKEKTAGASVGVLIAAIVFSCLPLFYIGALLLRVRS